MSATQLRTTSVPAEADQRPRDDELDLFGLTHTGKVRQENQDQFLLCTVHPQVVIHGTSLPSPETLPLRGGRLASVMMVADGVASGGGGAEASRLTVEAVTRYVSETLRCYHTAGSAMDEHFFNALKTAVFEAHAKVKAEAESHPEVRHMATTLTLVIGVWPYMYTVQVGDSRFYYCFEGELRQVTRDQTMAQELVDRGALPAERAAASPFSHILVSSIGGEETSPEVSRIEVRRGGVLLLCSDGLTKHVSDDEIAAEIGRVKSSEQLCHRLLDLALERGGTDNITVLVARRRSTT